MWPILIGVGAYLLAVGVQEAMKENREEQKALLPPKEPTRELPPPETLPSHRDCSDELQEVLRSVQE